MDLRKGSALSVMPADDIWALPHGLEETAPPFRDGGGQHFGLCSMDLRKQLRPSVNWWCKVLGYALGAADGTVTSIFGGRCESISCECRNGCTRLHLAGSRWQ